MRPRVSLGAALTLVAFVLSGGAPFFLPAFGLLLVFSHPARGRTWLWIALAAYVTLAWLLVSGGLADQVVKGWVVVATGTFLASVLLGRRQVVDAATFAVLAASVAVLAWLRVYGLDLQAVVAEAVRGVWRASQVFTAAAPQLRPFFDDLSASAATSAPLFPAVLLLCGWSGLLLAWRWYHFLADRPVGEPPGPLREFRFSDHYIWFLVAGLAGTLAQAADLLPPGTGWPADLLVLFGGLYLARGMAVVRDFQQRRGPLLALPLLVLLAALMFVLFLLPFALVALVGLGLADTWLDFRRPPAVAPGE